MKERVSVMRKGLLQTPHLCDSSLGTRDPNGGATVGFRRESTVAAATLLFTGLHI